MDTFHERTRMTGGKNPWIAEWMVLDLETKENLEIDHRKRLSNPTSM